MGLAVSVTSRLLVFNEAQLARFAFGPRECSGETGQMPDLGGSPRGGANSRRVAARKDERCSSSPPFANWLKIP